MHSTNISACTNVKKDSSLSRQLTATSHAENSKNQKKSDNT